MGSAGVGQVANLPSNAKAGWQPAPCRASNALLTLCLVIGLGGLTWAEEPTAILSVSETPPLDARPTSLPDEIPRAAKVIQQPAPVDIQENLSKARPVVPPTAEENVIDLGTALRLAEVENPTIAIGRQAIQEALAKQLQARSLALPHLRAGSNFHLHNGVLQNSFGLMRHVESRSLYFGGGARALAAETVAFPMVQFSSHLGDAYFEPLAARQMVFAGRARSAAIANIVLLEVAERFLDLMSAEGALAAIRQSEIEMNLIVQTTAAFAKTGRGRDADAKRARTEALLLHAQEESAEERAAVAAAELARVLHLDPSVRLRTPAKTIALVDLVDSSVGLDQLLQIAQTARPELAALRAEIVRKDTQIRQERLRPLFPTLAVGYCAGAFGGGTNRADLVPIHPQFGRIGSRSDVDIIAYWSLQNLGAGNLALQNQRRAERGIAEVEQVRMFNQIRREVAGSLALTQARRQQVDIALKRLQVAEKGFREDYQRARNVIGLPIEVLNSMNRLVLARLSLTEALSGYNQAQFQLFVALGQTPLAASTVAQN